MYQLQLDLLITMYAEWDSEFYTASMVVLYLN